jgi:hypothetical protein
MTRHPDLDCDECGFTYDEAEAAVAAGAIRDGADAIAAVLVGRDEGAARRRPAAGVWSTLEYACHVRDVLLVQRERVLLARVATAPPALVPMGRDERVELDGYRDQHPADVARQLRDAALLFGNVLDRLDDEAWSKRLVYNFPSPTERTLRWVAVHTLHEVRHHFGDITRG